MEQSGRKAGIRAGVRRNGACRDRATPVAFFAGVTLTLALALLISLLVVLVLWLR